MYLCLQVLLHLLELHRYCLECFNSFLLVFSEVHSFVGHEVDFLILFLNLPLQEHPDQARRVESERIRSLHAQLSGVTRWARRCWVRVGRFGLRMPPDDRARDENE